MDGAANALFVHRRGLSDLSRSLSQADGLFNFTFHWSTDEEKLLATYLGAAPFPSRSKVKRVKQDERLDEIRRQQPKLPFSRRML